MRDGFAGVFGGARELKSLWSVEGCREADFADFFRVGLDGRLAGSQSKPGGKGASGRISG